MIKKLFNHTSSSIIAGAAVLALATIASRALGFARNALLASGFGAGEVLDAYFLAFRLPDLFFNLLFFGALSAGFVPVFMKVRSKSEERAWKLANDIFNLSLLAFSLFGIIFFFAAPWVLRQIAPGFGEETMNLAVTMSRIMFLQPIFLGLSGIFSGVLQSARKFFSYSLAPIFYNLGIIFGIVVLADIIGPVGLAWGVVVGAVAHFSIQYPAARDSGWRWKPVLKFKMQELKRVFLVMVPRSLALIVQQVNLIVLISLATVLGAGSVAVFNFANDLYGFPLGVVVIPLGVAAFPAFVSALERGKEALGAVFTRTLRQLLFVLIPLVALAFVLRAQVVRLTLGYGEFGWTDTVLTIDTLTFFLVGLAFHGIFSLVLRGYFALEDAKTPLIVLIFGSAITIGSAWWFRGQFGVAGLALGMAVGTIFNSLVLFGLFARQVVLPKLRRLLRYVFLFSVLALASAGIARWVLFWTAENILTTHRVWGLLVQTTLATIAGGGVYLFTSWLLDIPEIETLRVKITRKLTQAFVFEELPEEELPR